ncbi:uncharacterized protein BXZ73DRAFT_88575 [Epithele typhae]|uniref:uncharacterized protein n=1 Tax=Epithele typhae TaxID=378194 RepID=UPI002007EA63|nr:uncharacterized protein BXZ73DRAFT_88575 [Epithele typhae]KAH9940888.1 hypothetical protein BXZ73DRAFT_88575 [Epithele typhae]
MPYPAVAHPSSLHDHPRPPSASQHALADRPRSSVASTTSYSALGHALAPDASSRAPEPAYYRPKSTHPARPPPRRPARPRAPPPSYQYSYPPSTYENGQYAQGSSRPPPPPPPATRSPAPPPAAVQHPPPTTSYSGPPPTYPPHSGYPPQAYSALPPSQAQHSVPPPSQHPPPHQQHQQQPPPPQQAWSNEWSSHYTPAPSQAPYPPPPPPAAPSAAGGARPDLSPPTPNGDRRLTGDALIARVRQMVESYRLIIDSQNMLYEPPRAAPPGHHDPFDRLLQAASLGAQMLSAAVAKCAEPPRAPPPAERGDSQDNGDGDGGRRQGQTCLGCSATSTPEWRRGPMGPRTLCNACGLVYAKLIKKRNRDGPGRGRNGQKQSAHAPQSAHAVHPSDADGASSGDGGSDDDDSYGSQHDRRSDPGQGYRRD